jgi:hypothetical protein
MFATSYFKKYIKYQQLIDAPVAPDTQLFIIIPCYKEPDIIQTLNSLKQCDLPDTTTEVFVIINEPEGCDDSISAFNLQTYSEIQNWVQNHSNNRLKFFSSPVVKLPQKWAGVGMARKRGMDEGLWRFNILNRKSGIIVSLDADTLVDKNYLIAIDQHFRENPFHVGATIAFSHQLEGISSKQREGILLYEKYLKYYKQALTYAGYPNALFTIGSAFAVTSEAYLKRGGMTRRKAGEDFYFLQTLTQIGKVGEINNAEVHPSARVSDRVPFGTGPAMKHWMENTADLRYTYNLQAFIDLKRFFDIHQKLYRISPDSYQLLIKELPLSIVAFLEEDNFYENIENLSANCSNQVVFSDRFFHLFNAFKILKYINFAHGRFYGKKLLDEVWDILQEITQ